MPTDDLPTLRRAAQNFAWLEDALRLAVIERDWEHVRQLVTMAKESGDNVRHALAVKDTESGAPCGRISHGGRSCPWCAELEDGSLSPLPGL